MSSKKSSIFGFGVIIGTLIGGLTALFLSPSSGKKNRQEAAKKIKELKTLLREHQLEDKVKEIFGEATSEAKAYYLKAKDELIKKAAELKEKVKDIDKEKYSKLAKLVVAQLKKEAKYSEKILEKLEKNLAEDWNKIVS